MSDENAGGIRDGMKQGLGALSAFKEAVEETINEARDRGDLTPERAREIMRSALERAQTAAEGARGRLDLVPRKELDDLAAEVEELQTRVRRLEALAGLDPRLEAGPEAGTDAAQEPDGEAAQAGEGSEEGSASSEAPPPGA